MEFDVMILLREHNEIGQDRTVDEEDYKAQIDDATRPNPINESLILQKLEWHHWTQS